MNIGYDSKLNTNCGGLDRVLFNALIDRLYTVWGKAEDPRRYL